MSKVIYFRASSYGNLMTEPKGSSITDKQLETLNDFEDRIREGKKPLTDNQRKLFLELKEKRDKKPELSETAKSEVEKIWLLNEKGFWEDLNNKFLTKGLMSEQDGLELMGNVIGDFILKNDERKNIVLGEIEGTDIQVGLTGESDAFINDKGVKTVIDIKCSWNPKTFLNAKLTSLYEYQLRLYMYLYDVEEAQLCYCLVDSPENLIEDEKRKTYYKYFSSSMTNEEVQELEENLVKVYEQIEQNMRYSNSENYTEEERIKIFKISRDRDIEQKMLEKLELASDYYTKIKLNQK